MQGPTAFADWRSAEVYRSLGHHSAWVLAHVSMVRDNTFECFQSSIICHLHGDENPRQKCWLLARSFRPPCFAVRTEASSEVRGAMGCSWWTIAA